MRSAPQRHAPTHSGNSKNLTQTTIAAQARIVNAGVVDTINGQPAAVFDGTASVYSDSSPGMYAAGSASVLTVLSGSAQANARIVVEGNTGNNNPQYAPLVVTGNTPFANASGLIRNDANTVLCADNGGGLPAIMSGSAHQTSTVDTGSSLNQYTDGASSKTDAYTRSGTMTVDVFALGALIRTTTSNYVAASIPEVVIWNSALTTGDRQTGEGNQKAFYSTP
jgi:hypothetical protein